MNRYLKPLKFLAPALLFGLACTTADAAWHHGGGGWHGGPGYWGGPAFYPRASIGLYVPVLPPFYSTWWYGGVPYYYADGSYYLWDAPRRTYVVTSPPDKVLAEAEPGKLYVYPRNGQSEAQQSQDRYDCHAWARSQTGVDPTDLKKDLKPKERVAALTEYRHAEQACLEGRGYTAR